MLLETLSHKTQTKKNEKPNTHASPPLSQVTSVRNNFKLRTVSVFSQLIKKGVGRKPKHVIVLHKETRGVVGCGAKLPPWEYLSLDGSSEDTTHFDKTGHSEGCVTHYFPD